MFFPGKPELFESEAECVGCYVMHNGLMLFLQKQLENPHYPGQWGTPAGHVEPGESHVQAVRREIAEETGLEIVNTIEDEKFSYLARWSVIHPRKRFNYHLFRVDLTPYGRLNVQLSAEHRHFCWVTPRMALMLNLIEDEDKVLRHVFRLLPILGIPANLPSPIR